MGIVNHDRCAPVVRDRPHSFEGQRLLSAASALALGLCVTLSGQVSSAQQLDPVAQWATNTSYEASLRQNVVYQRAGGIDLRLDVLAQGGPGLKPVVVYFHGGGWVEGDKEGSLLRTLPYVAWGFDVVNVEYRLASQALAPAAVEDGRCALHWVAREAKHYGFDTSRIIVAGESAGGHLALTTGMLTTAAGFDNSCEAGPDDWQLDGPKDVKVAAIIDFFGVIDLPQYLQKAPQSGPVLPMPRNFVLRWLGDQPDVMDLAKRVSPITYVNKNTPPILIVHGEKDPYVPYKQAVALHEALDRCGVTNQLITIQGGHGASPPNAWTPQQNIAAHEAVFAFLKKTGVISR